MVKYKYKINILRTFFKQKRRNQMEIMNEVKKVMLASVIATASVGVTTQASAEELKPTEPISGSQQKTATQKTVTETDVAISQANVEEANTVVKKHEEIVNSAQNEVKLQKLLLKRRKLSRKLLLKISRMQKKMCL